MRCNNGATAWTPQEDAWIREIYPNVPWGKDRVLPGRSHNAIKHRASRLGIKKNPETMSIFMSQINSGRTRTPENRAKIAQSLTGVKQSEATKQKRSETHKAIAKFGPENSNWKESITAAESRWRARHLLPPGPCAQCDHNGVDVHHKDEDPFNNEPSNLIRLCRKHHGREHARLDRIKKQPELESVAQ